MKNFLNNTNKPVIICLFCIVVLCVIFVFVFNYHSQAEANLGKQQQWASGKDSFDRAYEIAAADKDTPDKTLYVPKLREQIGKSLDEAIKNIGQGAAIVSTVNVGKASDKVEFETTINLTNESGDNTIGNPTVVAGTNHNGVITKISFTCNTWLLGYGALSFIDLINNENIVEKTFTEAGLNLKNGSVVLPTNRAKYTVYESDGTTVRRENCTFEGSENQDGTLYKWYSNVNFDYTKANQKGNLAETVRSISIEISI